MAEFFYMGGYAGYVWSSYAIATVVLVLNIVLPLREQKNIHKRIVRIIKQEQQDASAS